MPATETSQLGHLIRRFRLAAELSQEELAERAGVSARAVSDMERGLRTAPRLETVRMLADGLALEGTERANLLAAARPELRDEDDATPTRPRTSSAQSTTLPLAPRPLPVPPDPLIGRDQDVEQIGTLLMSERVRLVTLTGPGGVGKTRLSLAVAAQISPGFVDGVAFVDLSFLTRSDQVEPAIVSALGIPVDPRLPSHHALLATLRERSLLLVLDTFEHLLDAAPLLSELLPACPAVKILATSRVRLRLRGEHVVLVQPLPVPVPSGDNSAGAVDRLSHNPAVQLFIDRAQEASFGFALDVQNATAIAGICRRLDGLPLAIELAASRVGLLPPAALLERLGHRLPALTGGARDAPLRQQTLRDAIAWSYDLLRPAEQAVFRRLSVFAGGFALDAAEAVAGDAGIDLPAAIETLAESSLLSPSREAADDPRFTMLDTIHEFAASLLEQSGESASVQRRHADWCIEMAEVAGEELDNCRNEMTWFRKLDAEQANMRSAIDFLLGSGDGAGITQLLGETAGYWTDRPYPLDIRHWLETAIPIAPESPEDSSVRALFLLAWSAGLLGDFEYAVASADRQLHLAEKVGTPLALGAAHASQGQIAEFTGQVDRAAMSYERSLSFFRKYGRIAPVLWVMLELGGKWLLAGKVEQAVAMLDESITAARQTGADTVLAYGLIYRGFAGLVQQDPSQAARRFSEGLALAQRFRMDRYTLAAIGGLSGVALALDQADRAARLQGAIESARQSSGVGRIAEAASVDVISLATRERLGPDAYEAHVAEGSRMTYEQAIEMALAIAASATAGAVTGP
jgi:predicted ATPase/transcriptional regulator with XRE-family HTH domain